MENREDIGKAVKKKRESTYSRKIKTERKITTIRQQKLLEA